jgi:hypothetical protein
MANGPLRLSRIGKADTVLLRVHSGYVGIFSVRPSASDDAVSLKHHLAAARHTVGDNPYTPRVTGLFGQPTRVQQRRFAPAIGTGHLAGENVI